MRNIVLTLVTVALLSMAYFVARAEGIGKPPALRQLAGARGITIGSCVDEDALRDDAGYAAMLGREFSMVTPQNSMKFDELHVAPFHYTFETGDRVVDFAEKHGMQVHGHVLVWHEQLPDWLTKRTWTPEQLRTILREHIFRVVGHYRGRIPIWDVVNEAIDDNGEMRKTIWLKGIGPEYISLAFQWAHEADPNAHLWYNDYGGEGMGRKSDAIFKLLEGLRQHGVPVDGVGLQSHFEIDEAPNPEDVRANMQRLARLGLAIHVSELDVGVKMPATPDKLAAQAKVYRDMMRACLSVSACKHFTLWGFTDRYSWIPEAFPGLGAALIFDEQMRPKPSYQALVEALAVHQEARQ